MSDIKELKEEDLENITGGIEEDLSNYYGEWKQIIYFKKEGFYEYWFAEGKNEPLNCPVCNSPTVKQGNINFFPKYTCSNNHEICFYEN